MARKLAPGDKFPEEDPRDAVIARFLPYLERDGLEKMDEENIGALVPWALKRYLVSILRDLTQYKKKYKVIHPLFTGDGDPQASSPVSEVVYASNKVTAKDFFECLKANPEMIPVSSMYEVTVQRVLHKVQLAEEKKRILYREYFTNNY